MDIIKVFSDNVKNIVKKKDIRKNTLRNYAVCIAHILALLNAIAVAFLLKIFSE